MADLGKKHECAECGTKYYDLGKSAPTCPKCGFDPSSAEAAEGSGKAAGGKAKKKAAKKKPAKKKAPAAKKKAEAKGDDEKKGEGKAGAAKKGKAKSKAKAGDDEEE